MSELDIHQESSNILESSDETSQNDRREKITLREKDNDPLEIEIDSSHQFFDLHPRPSEISDFGFEEASVIKTTKLGTTQVAILLVLECIYAITETNASNYCNYILSPRSVTEQTTQNYEKMSKYFNDIFSFIITNEKPLDKLYAASNFIYGDGQFEINPFNEFMDKLFIAYGFETLFSTRLYNFFSGYYENAQDHIKYSDPVILMLCKLIQQKINELDNSIMDYSMTHRDSTVANDYQIFKDKSYFNLQLFVSFEPFADHYLKYYFRTESCAKMLKKCNKDTINNSLLGKFYVSSDEDVGSLKVLLHKYYINQYHKSINDMRQLVSQRSKQFSQDDKLSDCLNSHFVMFDMNKRLPKNNILKRADFNGHLVCFILTNHLFHPTNTEYKNEFGNLKKLLESLAKNNSKYSDICNFVTYAAERQFSHTKKINSEYYEQEMLRLGHIADAGHFLVSLSLHK